MDITVGTTDPMASNTFHPKDIALQYNKTVLANIVNLVPLVVKSISERDASGAVNSSGLGQNTLKSIVAGRLANHFMSSGV